MGKSKPNKKIHHKQDVNSPTGLLSVKQTDIDAELLSTDVSDVDSLIEDVRLLYKLIHQLQELNFIFFTTFSVSSMVFQLRSPSPETRQYSCTALTIRIAQKPILEEVLRKNITRIAAPLLLDTKQSVQIAASSLLR